MRTPAILVCALVAGCAATPSSIDRMAALEQLRPDWHAALTSGKCQTVMMPDGCADAEQVAARAFLAGLPIGGMNRADVEAMHGAGLVVQQEAGYYTAVYHRGLAPALLVTYSSVTDEVEHWRTR